MACKRSAVRSRVPPPNDKSLSSRGLGHYPFTVSTGVRIPVGTPALRQATDPKGLVAFFIVRPVFAGRHQLNSPPVGFRDQEPLLRGCLAGVGGAGGVGGVGGAGGVACSLNFACESEWPSIEHSLAIA